MKEVVVTTGAIRCAKLRSKCHYQQPTFLQASMKIYMKIFIFKYESRVFGALKLFIRQQEGYMTCKKNPSVGVLVVVM